MFESYFCVLLRYHLGDYGGEILNEVKLNRPEKEMSTTPSTLHNGNHHKVQECKVKVSFLLMRVSCYQVHCSSGYTMQMFALEKWVGLLPV